MRVLITGGYGCIGSWIAKVLIDRGDRIVMFDVRRDPHRLEMILPDEKMTRIEHVDGDVTNLDALVTAIKEQGITHVLHLAGLQVPICRQDPIRGAMVNVVGTLNVFEAIKRCGLGRVVYASSAAVFGPPEAYQTSPLPDDVPLKPSTHYGVFKCCNEGNARVYFSDHGISSIGLRPWTVYGVGRDFGMTSEPTKAIKAVAMGRKYHITYGGFQDLQYVEDVARLFVRCLEVPFSGAASFNIRGEVVDLKTFHETLCRVEPAAASLVTYGEGQIPIAYDLDDSGLRRLVGSEEMTPLEEGIQKTLEKFRVLLSQGRLSDYDLPRQES